MFTVCPKCSLKLVVTAADLRAAQGYVRCGRCSNVFNALVGLTDEQQAVLAQEERAGPDAALAPAAEHPGAAERPSAAEDPGAAEHAGAVEDLGPALDEASLEFDPATTDVSAIFVEPDADRGDGAASAFDPQDDVGRPVDVVDQRIDFDSRTDLDLDTGLDPATNLDRSEDSDPHVDLEATDEFELADLEPLLDMGKKGSHAPVNTKEEDVKGAASAAAAAADSASAAAEELAAAGTAAAGGVAADGDAADGDAADGDVTAGGAVTAGGGDVAAGRVAASSEGRADESATGWIPPSSTGSAGEGGETASAADTAADTADAVHAADAPSSLGSDDAHPATAPEADPAEVDALLAQAATAPAPRRRLNRVLQGCSVALALLLAAQLVNHYRVALAGVAMLHGPLTRAYAALGRPIMPRWNVKAYEVRQLGAVISPADPGALTVRASIENTAARQQPLPLLRVMVQDRFGNVVAARDVSPRAYLPPTAAGHRWLGAGQRVDAQVALADPGTSVVGFEIDACLADEAGHVACANGSSPAPGRAAR